MMMKWVEIGPGIGLGQQQVELYSLLDPQEEIW